MSNDRILKILDGLSSEWAGRPVTMSPVNPLMKELSVLYVGLGFMTSEKDGLVSQRGKIDINQGAVLPKNSLFVDVLVGAPDNRGNALGGRFQGVMTAAHHLPRGQHGNLEERLNDFIQEAVHEARSDYYYRLARNAGERGPHFDNLGRPRHEDTLTVQFKRWRPNRRGLLRAMNEASALLASDERIRFPSVEAEMFSEHLRFVNSEGACHADFFHGIRYELTGRIEDSEGRELSKYTSLYTVGDDFQGAALLRQARALKRYLLRELRAPLQEPTVLPVLLDHNAAHALIHESTTHPLELRRIIEPDFDDDEYAAEMGLGFAPESFGTRVAAPGVTLRSDPALVGKNGETLWATSFFDLEGTRARSKALIERGILKGAYATRSDVERLRALTGYDIYPGDARVIIDDAESTFPPAYPRQSNTVFRFANPDGAEYRTMKALRERFVEHLRDGGHEYGLFMAGSAGETDTHARGTLYPTTIDRIYASGRVQPVKGAVAHATAQHFLRNIVAAGGGEHYTAGLCGLGNEDGVAWMRIGMHNPALIVDGMTINAQTLPRSRAAVSRGTD